MVRDISLESELQHLIIEDFNKYFDFNYVDKEVYTKRNGSMNGYIDILGEDEENFYLIELKKDEVNKHTIDQVKSYMDNFDPKGKNVVGIACAPMISNNLNMGNLPENLYVKELNDFKYVPSTNSRVISVPIDEETLEAITDLQWELMIMSRSAMIKKLIIEGLNKQQAG